MKHTLFGALFLLALDLPTASHALPPDFERTPAFEVNVLWPFFPGGIVDLKVVVPLLNERGDAWRGELVTGLYSDFSWGPVVRPADDYGKVWHMGAKLGWRQFFDYGVHLDVTANIGWRHEEQNIYDGGTLDALACRLYIFAGWQVDLSERVYLNIRGGIAPHVFRTDRFADKEKPLAAGGDVNLGVRF